MAVKIFINIKLYLIGSSHKLKLLFIGQIGVIIENYVNLKCDLLI